MSQGSSGTIEPDDILLGISLGWLVYFRVFRHTVYPSLFGYGNSVTDGLKCRHVVAVADSM